MLIKLDVTLKEITLYKLSWPSISLCMPSLFDQLLLTKTGIRKFLKNLLELRKCWKNQWPQLAKKKPNFMIVKYVKYFEVNSDRNLNKTMCKH